MWPLDDGAAVWTDEYFYGVAILISLMSTVASLPFLPVSPWSAALSPIRSTVQKLIMLCQHWVGGHGRWLSSAWLAASAGWPYLILVSVSFGLELGLLLMRRPGYRSCLKSSQTPSCSSAADLEWFANSTFRGNYRSGVGGFVGSISRSQFVFALNGACFLLIVLATRQCKQPAVPAKLPSERFFESFGTIFHYVRYAPGFQAVLARNFLFALFISVIPALMPVVGLVAAQRAMPSWARGRMNATVIMISQGAMALGGVIWGSAAATAGASYTLLEQRFCSSRACFWPVGFRSALPETSNRGSRAFYPFVSNQRR